MRNLFDRADTIIASGARGSINRRDAALEACFTPVPESAADLTTWEQDGEPLLNAFRAQHDGRLADYVVSHAGELSFPRSFQLLAEGGALTFYGASSGYHFTFVGKSGAEPPSRMLERAALRAGEAVLVYYGVGDASKSLIDDAGLEAIEAAISAGARVCVVTPAL